MTNEYIKQAEDFLKATGTTFEIVYQYTGPHFQGEKDKRDVYRFTLKNAKGEYSSTFGDSINNTEKRAAVLAGRPFSTVALKDRAKWAKYTPSAYDVLACLEKYPPDTFESWCSDCGYNEQPLSEYPRVMTVYNSCVEQYRALARMFTPEQMEQLQEIA